MRVKAAYISKFSTNHHTKTMQLTSFDKLNTQIRAKEETEADLARQTGDPALYGTHLALLTNRLG
jgi:hypothetical protein